MSFAVTAQLDEEIEPDNDSSLTVDDVVDDEDGNERSLIADDENVSTSKNIGQHDMENLLADPKFLFRIRARIIKRLGRLDGIQRPSCQKSRYYPGGRRPMCCGRRSKFSMCRPCYVSRQHLGETNIPLEGYMRQPHGGRRNCFHQRI